MADDNSATVNEIPLRKRHLTPETADESPCLIKALKTEDFKNDRSGTSFIIRRRRIWVLPSHVYSY